ncbi:hypothetical protein BH11PLA2_BH11PLA2_01730 [soil metagenome]
MIDSFERLGLPRRFSLDTAALERSYLERSRALHPDFHHASSDSEQDASQAMMAALNEAYAALSDPFRRINHLLMLAGGSSEDAVRTQDPAFLMEMMDYRERLEAGERLADELNAKLSELLNAAGAPFDVTPVPDDAARSTIRKQLNAAKTMMSLLRDS